MNRDDNEGPEMTTTSTLHPTHYERPAAHHATQQTRRQQRPPFWRAPFSAFTYRELGFALTGLPVAIAGFVFVITLFSVGTGLAVTVLGLPVLAAMTAGARGFAALERHRARSLLGEQVEAPAPVRPARDGFWGAMAARLTDPAGWKAALYQVLMFPWAVASFVISVTFLLTAWVTALYPLYHWVFARYTDWPGYRIYDYSSGHGVRHEYYITAPWQIAGVSLVGFALVLLTPQLIRGLTSVNRIAIQGLLGRR